MSNTGPLFETAESLARTARELERISPDEWLAFEEEAAYLKKAPKAFEKIVARGEVSSVVGISPFFSSTRIKLTPRSR
jgi:sarcosine oxidase gamma subunit